MVARMAVLLTIIAAGQEGSYSNKDLKIRFNAAPKEYELRTKDFKFQWGPGVICEIVGKDNQVGGALVHYESAMKAEKYADWREEAWKKMETVKNYKRLKSEPLEKKNAEWLRREYTLDSGDYTWHYLAVFAAKGKHNFEITLWVSDQVWNDYKESISKVVDSLEYGDSETGEKADPKTDPKGGNVTYVPTDAWKGCGKDSWVKYKLNSAGSEMEIVNVLLEHEDGKSYTMRSDIVMTGNKLAGQPMKFVVGEAGGAPPMSEADKPKIEEGEETVKVAKGEFKCRWTKTTTKNGVSKTWTNDSVPYKMVKSESEMSGAKSSMELVDFEKK